MPNHGKGGRPRHGQELKQKQIPLKVEPALRAQLDAAAERAGLSLTREVEKRLKASLDMDGASTATMKLLASLAADIGRAESLTGEQWQDDLRTWAMVREAVASGEIERRCPEEEAIDTDKQGEVAKRRSRMEEIWASMKAEYRLLGRYRINSVEALEDGHPKHLSAEKVECLMDAANLDERDREMVRQSVTYHQQLEAEYQEHHRWIDSARAGFNATITQAALDWEQHERQHGRFNPREWRPGFMAETAPPPIIGGAVITLDGLIMNATGRTG
jgi:hypothetical protein